MTIAIVYLLISFIFGAALSACVCLWIHRMHKKAWQLEYRRLMDGIKKAWLDVDKPNIPHSFISNDLRKLFYDDPN